MKILLKDSVDTQSLLDDLVQASFSVLEGQCSPSLRDDLRMGLYVALRQVLSERLVARPDCGKFSVCADLPEARPFPPTERYAPRRS